MVVHPCSTAGVFRRCVVLLAHRTRFTRAEVAITLISSELLAGGSRFEHVESCTTHNMMKLVELLLRASRARGGRWARYAAWIERALFSGVLGTQRGEEPGAYLYFMPLGNYVSKAAPQAWRPLAVAGTLWL